MSEKVIGIDLHAKRNSHCLYHLGFAKYYSPHDLLLHSSSEIMDAAKAYNQILEPKITYSPSVFLVLKCFYYCRSEYNLHVLGIRLWLLILLFPLFATARNKVTIHVHGQIYALIDERNLKYKIWKFISLFCKLVVANPFYQGPEFVEKIQNINIIKRNLRLTEEGNSNIKVGTMRNTSPSILTDFHGFKIFYSQNDSYMKYVETLERCNYALVEFPDEYYMFSPSGRLSDAKNFSQVIVIDAADEMKKKAEAVCAAYGLEFIHLKDFKRHVS